MSEDLTVQLGDWDLVARPAMGGALVACRYRGRNVLREAQSATHVTEVAAYPMVPFCGRIEHGRFQWDGQEVELAPNFLPEPHAIHGTGWTSIWGAETSSETLTLSMFNDIGWWPWPFLAKQVWRADAGRLTYQLSITNTGETAMPAGLGWHPFFPRNGASLNGGTAKIWEGAPGSAETKQNAPSADRDMSGERTIEGVTLDHTYDWPAQRAVLTYAEAGQRVVITASENASHVTLFSPADEDFICIEPLTHVPNALNMAHAPDMKVLQPGETRSLTVTLDIGSV